MEIKFEIKKQLECKYILKLEGSYNILNKSNSFKKNNSENDSNAYDDNK